MDCEVLYFLSAYLGLLVLWVRSEDQEEEKAQKATFKASKTSTVTDVTTLLFLQMSLVAVAMLIYKYL